METDVNEAKGGGAADRTRPAAVDPTAAGKTTARYLER
jgi:hypothetical protein